MSDAQPTGRAQPFSCPYCGETDIRPEDERDTYHCRICDRVWSLRYHGLKGHA
jgi:predicted RNA-binding Zn-ribbon protein involved in translation (DUF1610 family)